MSSVEAKIIDVPAVASANALTPMGMLDRAISQGAGIETLEKLMLLQERWEHNAARRAFSEAIAQARAEIPPIRKNRHVGYTSKRTGSDTAYDHEDLAEIARTVDPVLSKYGLSYRWRTSSKPNEPVVVTCIVSHRLGYSEENTLSGAPDNSGQKNSIQAVGSTCTFLQRYTLKAALGLAVSNDDDGRTAAQVVTIDAEEAQNLRDKIKAAGASEAKFLAWAKVNKIEDIASDLYDSCCDAIMNFKKAAP